MTMSRLFCRRRYVITTRGQRNKRRIDRCKQQANSILKSFLRGGQSWPPWALFSVSYDCISVVIWGSGTTNIQVGEKSFNPSQRSKPFVNASISFFNDARTASTASSGIAAPNPFETTFRRRASNSSTSFCNLSISSLAFSSAAFAAATTGSTFVWLFIRQEVSFSIVQTCLPLKRIVKEASYNQS